MKGLAVLAALLVCLPISAINNEFENDLTEIKVASLYEGVTDGMYYIDYITEGQSELNDPEYDSPGYLYDLGEIIKRGLKSHDPAVLIKYQWLKEKYSPHVKELKKYYKNDLDRDIQEAYLSLPNFK